MEEKKKSEVMAVYKLDLFVKLYSNKKLILKDDFLLGYFPGIQTRSNPPRNTKGNIIPLYMPILKDHESAVDWLFNDENNGFSKIDVLKVYFIENKKINYFIGVFDENIKKNAEWNFENKNQNYFDNDSYYQERNYDDGFESAFEGDNDAYQAWLYD